MIHIYHEGEVAGPWKFDGQWSFPLSEIGYLLENHDGESFIFHKHRLYEK